MVSTGGRIHEAHLKNAILDIDLSSVGVRDAANIDRRTAGVTGILPSLGSSTVEGAGDGQETRAVDMAAKRFR